jgi:hypothetical protein
MPSISTEMKTLSPSGGAGDSDRKPSRDKRLKADIFLMFMATS